MKYHRLARYGVLAAALVSYASSAAETSPAQRLVIPDQVVEAAPRPITVEDMSSLRRVDTLRLSRDRRRFAMLVRQADASTNSYRLGWFVGSTQDGRLVRVGDGGEARLAAGRNQTYSGFEHLPVRWSADGRWIAYARAQGGEVQLWRSRTDGSKQEQVTRNAADVRDLEWSEDGKSLYFTVGTSREELRAREAAKELGGYHYDTDLRLFTDLMALRPPSPGQTAVWVVTVDGGRERPASDSERGEFERARELSGDALKSSTAQPGGAVATRGDGLQARARLEANGGQSSRMEVSRPESSTDPIRCTAAAECSGLIQRVWWGSDANTVLFLRLDLRNGASLHAWNIASGAVSLVTSAEDAFLSQCDLAAGMRMVCVRETPTLPPHVAFIDSGAGSMQILSDINPEFRNIALGKVERFEWDTPKFKWSEPGARLEGAYLERSHGYILYPADFDPTRQYPVFINPYAAWGFDNISNQEYALHAMAASGFVVLNLNFPQIGPDVLARLGPDPMKLLYSAELGFPHASMYLESTVRALDLIVSRGWVDERRVGIGGVSQGAFIPLYLLLKHDRVAAVSIGTGTLSQLEYYVFTPRGMKQAGGMPSWTVKPVGPGIDFWKQIDLADSVETIEAPILINTPAQEIYSLVRLMKHMAEAGKPYDAYVFSNEPHIKVQPAHLRSCMQRNLDWFRFWLQSYEDPDPAKAEQYSRWRKLRELQAANGARLNQQPSAARVPVAH
jgi:dipeptidyl aminopeptidase/acylaminoacyl peptidase